MKEYMTDDTTKIIEQAPEPVSLADLKKELRDLKKRVEALEAKFDDIY